MHDYPIDSVLTVGGGRGFVVEARSERLIVTAGHCLPSFPPCYSFSDIHERTYTNLLGRLGEEPSVAAECLFADPIADLAILGPPDSQELPEEWSSYCRLLENLDAFSISDAPQRGRAWLLSLQNKWFECTIRHVGGPLWIEDASRAIAGGMSGSPVLSDNGSAVGIVCAGAGELATHGGPNPNLTLNLPGWCLRHSVNSAKRRRESNTIRIMDDDETPENGGGVFV